MADEQPIDALRLKIELQARASRELAGLTDDEKLRFIRDAAERFWSEKPDALTDEARKSA